VSELAEGYREITGNFWIETGSGAPIPLLLSEADFAPSCLLPRLSRCGVARSHHVARMIETSPLTDGPVCPPFRHHSAEPSYEIHQSAGGGSTVEDTEFLTPRQDVGYPAAVLHDQIRGRNFDDCVSVLFLPISSRSRYLGLEGVR
jgi:hypothetical protein